MINNKSGEHLKNSMSEMALAVNQSIGKEWHLLYGIYELIKEVYESYTEKETQCNIAQDIESCEECGFCEQTQEFDSDCISKKEALRIINDIGGCDATDEYERGFDAAVESCWSAINDYKTVVSKTEIARTPEEIVNKMNLHRLYCEDCEISGDCEDKMMETCKQHWLDWLTKKEV